MKRTFVVPAALLISSAFVPLHAADQLKVHGIFRSNMAFGLRGVYQAQFEASMAHLLLLLGNFFCQPPWMAVREAGVVGVQSLSSLSNHLPAVSGSGDGR
jgi:hypothetical protein